MRNDDIQELSAYIDGELDGAERERVEAALAESDELRDELERLRAVRSWARSFPGRKPRQDVWTSIEDSIAVEETSGHVMARRADGRHVGWRRFMAFIPFYSQEDGWSNGAKRTAIFGLAGIAVAGMGRSLYQEQRADLYEEKSRVKDEQLVRADAEATWRQAATSLRGQIGRRYSVRCPRDGVPGAVWGSGIYADDSSICTAAVHAGLIDLDRGGPVQVEIRPGQRQYAGTNRNGVSSHDYGAYPGSFAFVPAHAAPQFNFDFSYNFQFSPESSAHGIAWDDDARQLRGLEGTHHPFRCPGDGALGHVWGSGPYTDDSSICTAAVHAGLITPAEGGPVTIAVGGKHPRFVGTELNGVETLNYGSWEGSYSFVTDAERLPGQPTAEPIRWRESATEMRGWNGFQVTFLCPRNGDPSAVWGSEPYTDDSSICTAAVHAGVITLEAGGDVTIEIVPGRESYEGAPRNGVESRNYGKWSGSFRFVR